MIWSAPTHKYATLALWTLLLLLPWATTWNIHASDIELFNAYAKGLLMHNLVPYRTLHMEYPPAAMAVYVAPYLLVGPDLARYAVAFIALMGCCDGLQKIILWRSVKQHRWPFFVTLGTASALLFYCYLKRFDLVATLLTSAAGVALCANPASLMAWVWLSLGASVKLYPLMLAPLAALYSLHQGVPLRRLLLQTGLGASIGLAFLIGAYAVAGTDSFEWMHYHGVRGLHVATSYASIGFLLHGLGQRIPVDYAYGGSLTVLVPWGYTCARLSVFVMLGLVALTYAAFFRQLSRPAVFWRAATAIIAAMLLGSKVFSPQYMVWLVPLAAMACVTDEGFDTTLAFLLLLACLFTSQTYPGEERMGRGDWVKQLSLIARNGTLLLMWGYLMRYPLGRRRRSLADNPGDARQTAVL